MALGDDRVEVVGHVDRDAFFGGDLLDHVRLNPVGIVQFDQFRRRNRLALLGVFVGQLADAPATAVERLAVLRYLVRTISRMVSRFS